MPSTVDKQLDGLQNQIGGIKARIALPAYANASAEQDQILGHFLCRVLQMSEASDLVYRANLGTPLAALVRILCEDLFLCFWVSLSAKDAADYSSGVISEWQRFMRITIENGRGAFRHTLTHEDRTGEVLRRLRGASTHRVGVEQLARRLGLSKMYDLLYRFFSMEVHGKVFGLPSQSEEEGLFAALSAVVVLVKTIGNCRQPGAAESSYHGGRNHPPPAS
jgi:hypothetical protein